jgi:hypothetical protein
MAAAVSELCTVIYWDLVFSLFPGITFLFLAAMCFYNAARMPKHPLFRIQTIGLAGSAQCSA